MKPTEKRVAADKLLAWLKGNNIKTTNDTHKTLSQCRLDGYQMFDLWKGYEVLRIMGRVELNNPNGRKGFHVLSYKPLAKTLELKSSERICNVDNCPFRSKQK